MNIESRVGEGTVIEAWLPRHQGPAPDPPEVSREELDTKGDETVLVVEDEAALRRLLRRGLEAAGYRVVTAASAEEAREKMGARVELVLTDVALPGEDGVTLVDGLREDRPDLPALYMSGFIPDPELRKRLAPRLLRKPFSLAEAARRVRAILDATDP